MSRITLTTTSPQILLPNTLETKPLKLMKVIKTDAIVVAPASKVSLVIVMFAWITIASQLHDSRGQNCNMEDLFL